MDRFDTPDKIIGVGGAGSGIVYKFMEQDWILESAVGAGQFAGEEPQQLEAYTIDSSLDDDVHDRVDDIQSTIDELVTSHERADTVIDVSMEHRSMTRDVPSEWRKTNMLTSDADVGRMLRERGLNAWWFAEGREPLTKMRQEGFSGGVYRRRAVSKALFHLSEYAGDGVTPQCSVDDEVVMVAALGGGTGSGTVVDLAAEMDADHVDLFGVIPTTGEKKKEKANAFAALSELEYLETNGESPFRTITLIPYLGGSGGDGQATGEEAEKAAVRTVVGHHQAMRGDNLRDMLVTSSRNGPPSYSSFAVAAPKTVEYNIEKKDRAKAEIRETLNGRREELLAEANLCDLASAFLDREFPEKLDETDEPDIQERKQAVIELSNRVERVFEETLTQDAITVAGVGGERDELVKLYDRIEENVLNGRAVGGTEVEEAEARVETVADRVRTEIVPDDYGDDGTLGKQLAALVKQEMSVVTQRYEIVNRIYRLPSVADQIGLAEDEAVTVRDVFTDVVLAPDESLIGVVQNPAFTVVLDQYEEERDTLVQHHRQFTAFQTALRAELDDRVEAVREAIREPVGTVATVDRRFPEVATGDRNTVERIDRLVTELQATVDDIAAMTRTGAVDPTVDFDEFDQLNADLRAVGVDPIRRDVVEQKLTRLLDAKNASLDHNSGLLPGRPDRTADYQNALNDLDGTAWLEIGGQGYLPAVDEPFEVAFQRDPLRRYDEILRVRQGAIQAATEAALREVCQAEGELFEPEPRSLIESELDYTPENVRVTVSPPTGLTADRLADATKRRLREGTEGDPQIRLEEVFPPLSEAAHEPETVTATLSKAYLRPAETAVTEIETKLERLGDNEISDSEGVIETLRRLRALAGRFEQADVQSELPSVTAASEDEVYGGDFTELYEGHTSFDVGLDGGATRENHPYVHDRDADMADLAGNPDDIEESSVLENHEAEIFDLLADSAEDLFRGTYDRMPVTEVEPQGSGESVGAVYKQMRYVNLYFSRALDADENLTPEEGTIHERVADVFEQNVPFGGDTYGEGQFGIGGPDGVTMVTLIAGLTLDNLSRASGANGYRNTYHRMYRNHSFLPTHHAVGLGGDWDRWERLREWTADERDDETYGAFLYRDTLGQMDEEFVTHLQTRTDAEVVDLLGEMTTAETFDSTVDPGLSAEESLGEGGGLPPTEDSPETTDDD